jgi:hypothetical protein
VDVGFLFEFCEGVGAGGRRLSYEYSLCTVKPLLLVTPSALR